MDEVAEDGTGVGWVVVNVAECVGEYRRIIQEAMRGRTGCPQITQIFEHYERVGERSVH